MAHLIYFLGLCASGAFGGFAGTYFEWPEYLFVAAIGGALIGIATVKALDRWGD